ncbi:MAG TPA: hypothetical protein VIH93_12700 [Thermoanaerobaculia bacterium]
MKTTALATFTLLALLSFASAARAEEAAKPTALPASPAPVTAASPVSPVPGAGSGETEIAFDVFAKAQAVCTVSTVCPSGGPTLSCSGTTCSGNSSSVTCDGTTKSCPVPCTVHCLNNPNFGSCTSAAGKCSSGFDTTRGSFYIICDGHEIFCPACPNHQIRC